MSHIRNLSYSALCFGACLLLLPPAAAGDEVRFTTDSTRVRIEVGDRPLATYVFQDDTIPRPYFAHVHAPHGIQVTRNHPPTEGVDATDHATFHPGIWLAFGDISGNDYWRLKARVVHERFVQPPSGGAGQGSFAVRNRYLSESGERTVCEETCRFTFLVRPAGYLIVWDSEFSSADAEFVFGDQEEMGLGIRVATGIAARDGGRISDSLGRTNEKQVWGQQSEWCDYSGTLEDQYVGITLMPDPRNFRRSWYHARDYGFVAANPFGRNAFTRGEKSRVAVPRGESFRLRFGVLLHRHSQPQLLDLAAAYRDFLKRID